MVAIGTFLRAKRVHHLYPYRAGGLENSRCRRQRQRESAVLYCPSRGSQWAYTLRDNGRPWLPLRLHPGSCSQREPKRPAATTSEALIYETLLWRVGSTLGERPPFCSSPTLRMSRLHL